MKYFVLTLDALGLAAMCFLALVSSVLFSLWRLSMAGFLRLALSLSDMGLGMFSRLRLVNLQLITRGSKTWIIVKIGRLSLGGAIEKRLDGGFDVTSDISDRGDKAHTLGDVDSN